MIELKNVQKVYDLGSSKVYALRDVSVAVGRGEFMTIMGPSGSGKSTLLQILGLLDLPDAGGYELEGRDVSSLSDKELARIRNRYFGFVFQSFHLIPEFNALENVTLPLVFAGLSDRKRRERAMELLDQVGLKDRVYHYPSMLSGGEQQRVAIARALANDPGLLLADEPTGNLPSEMGAEILEILKRLNAQGMTVLMVTHDERLGRLGSRMIRIRDGYIEGEQKGDGPGPLASPLGAPGVRAETAAGGAPGVRAETAAGGAIADRKETASGGAPGAAS